MANEVRRRELCSREGKKGQGRVDVLKADNTRDRSVHDMSIDSI